MCERIFKYLDKSKTGKLSKNEFINGINTIFFGNLNDLYRLTFALCDFNEKNKIHKFNMKLILSYIPVETHEKQKEYLKNINTIVKNYFTNLDKQYPQENIKYGREISFDIYKNSIEEYINDKEAKNQINFNNNGAFLYFINIISYIYLNNPFNTENMNYCRFIKNKFLIKLPQTKSKPNAEKNNDKIPKIQSIQKLNESVKIDRSKNRSNSFHYSKKKMNSEKINEDKLDFNDETLLVKDLSDKKLIIFNSEEQALKSSTQKDLTKFTLYKNQEENSSKGEEKEISGNNEEYAEICFKYCEEDNSKFLKKYFAVLRGKEILFFSSKLKNELCSIWNIAKTIIIAGEKTSVSKYNYYPIKFINYNKSYSILYLEGQEQQKNFEKRCAKLTNYLKIEDFFEIGDKIGQGQFGLVKKCIEKKTQKEYAVKIMVKSKIQKRDLGFLIQERNFMSLVKHPNIVSLIRDFEDEKCLYFVMEYFNGGDLSKYLEFSKKKERNLERLAAKVIKTIGYGIEYLNQFGIVHRDIKPENIVFGREDDIKSIKIIDLGVAITLPYGQQSSDPIGTLEYIPPEMYTHNPYTYKVDVWSLGILLYYLASGGIVPFDDEKNDETIMGKKVVFTHQEYPEKYFGDKSKSLMNLIDKALEKNPEKRINIHDFLSEEWLNKYSQ
jgi:tRNA A-37 threonylcarbamoyl transferase component Bud32